MSVMRPTVGKYLDIGVDDHLIGCRNLFHRLAQSPETLVGSDRPLDVPPVPALPAVERSVSHQLEHIQQPLGCLHVALVAGLMEGKKDLVREPPLKSNA
jgi:hypothetical protein